MPEQPLSPLNYNELIDQLIPICSEAAKAILDVYYGSDSFDVATKSDDSPVTRADLAANSIIYSHLQALTPDIPIITEEMELAPYRERKNWSCYWLVDPLDGTKEFIKRNHQFTINIALVERNRVKMGIVYVPVSHTIYGGIVGEGAFKTVDSERCSIRTRNLEQRLQESQAIEVVASINHCNDATNKIISDLESNIAKVSRRSIGSSLKFCLLAEGVADVYPRMAPTCEWDTAAAQAVLEAAGGAVYQLNLTPLKYNTKDNLLNPYFIACGDKTYDWNFLAN